MSDVWHDEPHTRERWLLFVQRVTRPNEAPIKIQVAFSKIKAREMYMNYLKGNELRVKRYQYTPMVIHQTINSIPVNLEKW